MKEAITTLKERSKEREAHILHLKGEKRLTEEQNVSIKADSYATKAEMLKLQMSKTGMMAPKTSVQKITAKLNINDDDFKKTLNIIDHW